MLSPSRELRAVEGFDNHAGVRNALRAIAEEKGEWAGIPMPLDGERLVIEPTYPFADLSKIGGDEESKAALPNIRNTFHSAKKGRDVVVFDDVPGRVDWCCHGPVNSGAMLLTTLGCADAWGIEQEANAVCLLASLVSHRQFKQYMLTGMFLESSKRSGVCYMFRRLRPTIAMSTTTGVATVLAALCMHPIGYYERSWAGAMCPTDDVIAHLQLMRGDEPMLWRRCTQHPAWRPEAGL